MDGFMFGSCCVHDTNDNLISQQTTSNRYPDPTTQRTTTTTESVRRQTTYRPYTSELTSINFNTYRPKRPPRYSIVFQNRDNNFNSFRPPRPSIERVGVASTSEVSPTRPSRPAKPTSKYDWARPPPKVAIIPPRPPGRPPNWDKKPVVYFPTKTNVIDKLDDLNMISSEPEVKQNKI
jgi:hypothetical protein